MSLEIPEEWERVSGLHFAARVSWLGLAVDTDGNLVAFSERVLEGLPSVVAPEILGAAKEAGFEDGAVAAFAGPASTLGQLRLQLGDALCARDEYTQLGLSLPGANEDPVAGWLRIGELLRVDPGRRLPSWHERGGEPGSPRLFIRGATMLAEQLASAPPAPDGERFAGAAVAGDWEEQNGGLVAALRYVVMSRPSPSEERKQDHPDWRTQGVREMFEAQHQLDEWVDEGELEPWEVDLWRDTAKWL